MKKSREKVLVCMSGGVDSSVTAALLVRQGYDVTGAYMKQWSDTQDLNGVCTWKQDRRDALRVAAHLGIPLITLDFETEYKQWVTEYMFAEYEAGRTPNPDVLCNKYIKFDAWLNKAKELGFDYMATGHYARIGESETGNGKRLLQAKDTDKDQTYFLHQLTSEQLTHVLFPLGDFTKKEVRDMAKKWDLPTANRPESMGICFVGEVPMKDFLLQRIEKKPGDIVLADGTNIGTHDGLAFYTVGQRHIGDVQAHKSSDTRPLYVLKKNIEKNQLIVGFEDDPLMYTKVVQLEDMHFISEQPKLPIDCQVRMRHRQALQKATLTKNAEGYTLQFKSPQKAVTPGQFAVLYSGEVCLGGGVISS